LHAWDVFPGNYHAFGERHDGLIGLAGAPIQEDYERFPLDRVSTSEAGNDVFGWFLQSDYFESDPFSEVLFGAQNGYRAFDFVGREWIERVLNRPGTKSFLG
jgi:hypothetical protein